MKWIVVVSENPWSPKTQDIPISMVIFGYRFIPFWIQARKKSTHVVEYLEWIEALDFSPRFGFEKNNPALKQRVVLVFSTFSSVRKFFPEDLERTLSSALEGKTDELATCQVDSGRVEVVGRGSWVVNPHEIMIFWVCVRSLLSFCSQHNCWCLWVYACQSMWGFLKIVDPQN